MTKRGWISTGLGRALGWEACDLAAGGREPGLPISDQAVLEGMIAVGWVGRRKIRLCP